MPILRQTLQHSRVSLGNGLVFPPPRLTSQHGIRRQKHAKSQFCSAHNYAVLHILQCAYFLIAVAQTPSALAAQCSGMLKWAFKSSAFNTTGSSSPSFPSLDIPIPPGPPVRRLKRGLTASSMPRLAFIQVAASNPMMETVLTMIKTVSHHVDS